MSQQEDSDSIPIQSVLQSVPSCMGEAELSGPAALTPQMAKLLRAGRLAVSPLSNANTDWYRALEGLISKGLMARSPKALPHGCTGYEITPSGRAAERAHRMAELGIHEVMGDAPTAPRDEP